MVHPQKALTVNTAWKVQKAYLRLERGEEKFLRELGSLASEGLRSIIDRFYDHLKTFPGPRILLQDPEVVSRLKEILWTYWQMVFSGKYDEDYVQHRINMGRAHYRAGVRPEWFVGGYVFFQEGLLSVFATHFGKDTGRLLKASVVLGKIVNFDTQLALSAYFSAEGEEREKLREDLRSKEKLGTIGRVVGGVAHDLNNPLSGILGFSELLLGESCEPSVEGRLKKIHGDAVRCKRIVQDLLLFFRPAESKKERVGVNGIISRTIRLRKDDLEARGIQVRLDLEPGLPFILGDFHGLERVFDNLIRNAEDALESREIGGEIRIQTRCMGKVIDIGVVDNGPGIAPEIQDRIFEPLFTTKPRGKGTGFGLSICFGIVRDHGGEISVKSEAGKGADFRLTLPIPDSIKEDGREEEQKDPGINSGRMTRILVVDDDDGVLDLYKELLPDIGYGYRLARDGRSALEWVGKESFDSVICDFNLEDMGAKDFLSRLRLEHPEMGNRVIFSSGDTVSLHVVKFLAETGCPFLGKPFEKKELMAAIKGILESSTRES